MEEKRRLDLSKLSQDLGHDFKDLTLLDRALHHSSYVHEHPDSPCNSNERLEFLGDAVLELVITLFLYNRFPQASEGQLSRARSGVVNETRLAHTARSWKLGDYLLLGRGEENQGGRSKPSLLADALEAVLAAVYLDGGLEAVELIVHRNLGPGTYQAFSRAPAKDYKTRLQERMQEELRITPRYEVVAAQGPDHAKTFSVTLLVEDRPATLGQGRSKKEAEQRAARLALERMEQGLSLFESD